MELNITEVLHRSYEISHNPNAHNLNSDNTYEVALFARFGQYFVLRQWVFGIHLKVVSHNT